MHHTDDSKTLALGHGKWKSHTVIVGRRQKAARVPECRRSRLPDAIGERFAGAALGLARRLQIEVNPDNPRSRQDAKRWSNVCLSLKRLTLAECPRARWDYGRRGAPGGQRMTTPSKRSPRGRAPQSADGLRFRLGNAVTLRKLSPPTH